MWFNAELRHEIRNTHLLVFSLYGKVSKMSKEMDDLVASVQANNNASQSVLTLIQSLADQIKKANENDDSDAIEKLANDLQKNAASLSNAVAQNTPAANQPGVPADQGNDVSNKQTPAPDIDQEPAPEPAGGGDESAPSGINQTTPTATNKTVGQTGA